MTKLKFVTIFVVLALAGQCYSKTSTKPKPMPTLEEPAVTTTKDPTIEPDVLDSSMDSEAEPTEDTTTKMPEEPSTRAETAFKADAPVVLPTLSSGKAPKAPPTTAPPTAAPPTTAPPTPPPTAPPTTTTTKSIPKTLPEFCKEFSGYFDKYLVGGKGQVGQEKIIDFCTDSLNSARLRAHSLMKQAKLEFPLKEPNKAYSPLIECARGPNVDDQVKNLAWNFIAFCVHQPSHLARYNFCHKAILDKCIGQKIHTPECKSACVDMDLDKYAEAIEKASHAQPGPGFNLVISSVLVSALVFFHF